MLWAADKGVSITGPLSLYIHGYSKLADNLGENLAPCRIGLFLFAFDRRPFGMP